MGNQPHFCASKCGKADLAPSSKTQRKSPETQRFQGFSGGRGRRARSCFATPLAVPEKIFGLPLFLDFFDRCANPYSLYPPPAARAGVARHAPRASGSLLLYKTKKTSAQAEVFLVWQGQKGSNPRHAVLETAALPTELCPYTVYHHSRSCHRLVGLQGLEPGTNRL